MTILLAIDIQEGLLGSEAARAAVGRVLSLARSDLYDEVWATRFVNPGHAGLFLHGLGRRECRAGDPGTDPWGPLAPFTHRVIEKHTYGLPVLRLRELVHQHPDRVGLVELETDACVLASAFQFFAQGVRTDPGDRRCLRDPGRTRGPRGGAWRLPAAVRRAQRGHHHGRSVVGEWARGAYGRGVGSPHPWGTATAMVDGAGAAVALG